MPSFVLKPSDPGCDYDTDELAVLDQRAFTLMAYDPTDGEPMLVDDGGKYVTSGTFITRNLPIRALTSWFGGELEYDIPDGTGLEVFYSLDDGSNWVTCGSPVSWVEGAWPLSSVLPSQVKFKFVLTPDTDRLLSPWVGNLYLYGEVDYRFQEDILRSVKGVIDENASVNVRFRVTHDGSGAITFDTPLTVSSISVFKVSDRTTDYAASFNPTTKIITLSAGLVSGDALEIKVQGTVESVIRPDPDYAKANLPYFALRVLDVVEYGPGKFAGDEVEKFGDYAKTRQWPIPLDALVAIDCAAPTDVIAMAMADAVADLFERDDLTGIWHSHDMGYFFDIVEVTPATDVSVDTEELRDFQIRATIGGRTYRTGVRTDPLAQQIDIRVNRETMEVTE